MNRLVILILTPFFLSAGSYNVEKIQERYGSSSNLTLEAEKLDSDPSNPAFIFRSPNASRKTDYALIASNLLNEKTILSESARINKDGVLSDKYSKKPIPIIAQLMSPGEPMMIYLISQDRRDIASFKLIPHPISINGNGYQCSIEVVCPYFTNFLFYATGFEPNEEVIFTSTSHHERIQHKVTANEKGKIEGFISPAVTGVKHGVAKLELKGKQGTISLDYPWG